MEAHRVEVNWLVVLSHQRGSILDSLLLRLLSLPPVRKFLLRVFLVPRIATSFQLGTSLAVNCVCEAQDMLRTTRHGGS